MACYHPLKGFKVGLTATGKDKYKICSHDVDHLDYLPDIDKWFPYADRFSHSSYASKSVYNSIEIPCGKCVGCRLDYARSWADRCLLESLYYDSNYFVTLTYNNANLPQGHFVDDGTGEFLSSYSLRKKDFQDFMKRLRSKFGTVRFFACGEYGGKTLRPHYHVILFGLKLDDLQIYKVVGENVYYNSKKLEDVWKHGFCVITPLSYAACAYTTRYVVKKAKKYDRKDFESLGMEPEFTLMSRKPGLGRQFYEEHNMYKYDYVTIPTSNQPVKIRPSRYFDKQLERDNPDLLKYLKEKRLVNADAIRDIKLSQTDYDIMEMLSSEESSREHKVNLFRGGTEQ